MPSENKARAFEIYKEHNGEITNRKIAELLGEKEKTISAWKSRGKWKQLLRCSTTGKSVVLQQKKCSTKRGAPAGNKNAVGHGAPKGNKNAVGNHGGGQPGNKNAETHGLYSTIAVIPEEDKDLFEACAAIDSLEYELQVARYKVNRLIREQQARNMQGVMGGPCGAESFRLKDDFYEQAIQKGLDLVRKIEAQLQKARFDDARLEIERKKLAIAEKNSGVGDQGNEPVQIVDDIGCGADGSD